MRRASLRSALRVARGVLATSAVIVAGAASGCLSRPLEAVDPRITSVVTEQLRQGGVSKIDLVLAIDNSSSMADKQQILALAVPDLVAGLVNPSCLDDRTGAAIPSASQPSGPLGKCPSGSTREFPPVLDIHIGLVSSSLGVFGVQGINGCTEGPLATCPGANTTPGDDHGHLVTRSDACDSSGDVPTYQSQGFLAWDPAQALKPAGIAEVGAIGPGGFGTGTGLEGALHDLVVGDGQSGCGFESQDEAWYRFLVDPSPYGSISFPGQVVHTSGLDDVLLKQRKEFLRPDSLLAIIVVSDETDTSIKESSYYPDIAATGAPLPNPRSGCNNGPNDPCCTSCGLPAGKGCLDPDPQCAADAPSPMPSATALRAFGLISHKQRFGVEFFYPPSRYVAALKSPTVVDAAGQMVSNPIFTNLDPERYAGLPVRNPGLVFYAAITGVPWQLIARQKNGVPDLVNGVSTSDATQVGGFKTSAELSLVDKNGDTFWDEIAGDPEHYVAAKSPYMVESIGPRSGTDPITGATLSPPSTPNGAGAMVGGTLINDHERTIPTPAGDIEYACVFPILNDIDCSNPATPGDCANAPADSPLCFPNPNDGMRNTLQKKAKAYPSVKQLAIAHGLGDQGIAASICAKQLTDPTQPDYGYRPSVKAIIDRLKLALNGECLPRQLTPDAAGQVQCLILEGRSTQGTGPCNCLASQSRASVSAEHLAAQVAAESEPAGQGLDCFCEIEQTEGAALTDCQTATPATSNGWCYVDATQGAAEAAIVKECPPSEQRKIRFVGTGKPQDEATLFITCAGQ
jgi:hypothetical protein